MTESWTGAVRLADDIVQIRAIALAPVETAAALTTQLESAIAELLAINFHGYRLERYRTEAPALIYEIFNLQQDVRSAVEGWQARSLMTPANQRAVRNLLRILRYGADFLGELFIGFENLSDDMPTRRAFTGDCHNTLVPRALANERAIPFQSGDVLLVRGRLHNSAAIARIGDIDSQFSHVAMVYIDREGRHWAVESLIEEGAVIQPLSEVLGHNLGRAILFRHRDRVLAKNAATIIHDRVAHSLSRYGRRILYDFTMRPNRGRNLFCSKLVRQAFKEASDQRLVLPSFPTLLNMKNRDFVDRIGVQTIETFAPGDIEIEPTFDLIAEWQDYRVTSDLRLQDMVMDKIYEWQELHNYRFRETFKVRLISLLGRASSYLFEDIKDMLEGVLPKVPINMSRRAVAAIAMLHETAQPLYETCRKAERRSISETGLPLHPRDIYLLLERERQRLGDEIGYLKRRS
jgi:hypothetical protein